MPRSPPSGDALGAAADAKVIISWEKVVTTPFSLLPTLKGEGLGREKIEEKAMSRLSHHLRPIFICLQWKEMGTLPFA